MSLTKWISISLLSVLAVASLAFTSIKPNVIYGDDNRQDVYQVTNQALVAVADSTAAMIPNDNLSPIKTDGSVDIYSSVFGEQYGLCKDEPFYNQPNAAMCSAFLVGDDMLATAGHCVTTQADCDGHSFVFSYKMKDEKTPPTSLPSTEVYKCKSLLAREQLPQGQDYALIKLDRPVRGHNILKLATAPAQVNEPLIVIGHPSGIPTKISGGAFVRSVSNGFFVANLDTYGGNSGSAVFNANTLEVVGVLVRGETDFKYDGQSNCNRSNKCTNNSCRGEDSTSIAFVAKALLQQH